MKVFVGFFLVLVLVKKSHCGGSTASIAPRDLIIHGRATDILSEFSERALTTLQGLSDTLNVIARGTDNEDLNMLSGRALESSDYLKNAAKEKLEIYFQEFLDQLSGLVDVNADEIKEILDNSPPLKRDVARIQEFIKTGKLLFDSANHVVDGKNDEFIIQFMNRNQAENIKFNLSGC